MNAFVIDTNVPIVANASSDQASPECVLKCAQALEQSREGLICLDDGLRILGEYMSNLNMAGQPGLGDAFMRWVFENQANPSRCETVAITERTPQSNEFEEFPHDEELHDFDPSDRKFVAVALASAYGPKVLNAVDSDWWHARHALQRNGVQVEHVCGSAQFAR